MARHQVVKSQLRHFSVVCYRMGRPLPITVGTVIMVGVWLVVLGRMVLQTVLQHVMLPLRRATRMG